MPAHPTFYFKRSLVEKLGSYESHYFTAADYEFMARYLYRNKISSIYLPKLIVRMRKGGASNGNLYRRLRANRRDYLAMKKNNVPFPLFASVLKPVRKLPQYYNTIVHKVFRKKEPNKNVPQPHFLPLPAKYSPE
jgi:glycosyltransferase